MGARYIVVPTETGATARRVARLRPQAWIIAFSPFEESLSSATFLAGRTSRVRTRGRPSSDGGIQRGLALRRPALDPPARAPPGLAVVIQGNNRLEVIDLGVASQ